MTRTKTERYKNRLNLIFDAYNSEAKLSEKKARRSLEKRVRFLTGNTRLVNNKKYVVSGIFFSNMLLTDLSDLSELDKLLEVHIMSLRSDRLKRRLLNYSFVLGFQKGGTISFQQVTCL